MDGGRSSPKITWAMKKTGSGGDKKRKECKEELGRTDVIKI